MRKAGILLPITSLPSNYGVGTLGHQAFKFVDFLAYAGQSLWQILPVNPTGYGDSPYQSFCAFAGNPYNIDLDILVAKKLLLREEIGEKWAENPDKVDYETLFERRFEVLKKAAERFDFSSAQYLMFCQNNAYWLNDYALYMAIKKQQGQAGLDMWPAPLRLRKKKAMQTAAQSLAKEVDFWRCVQFFWHEQWMALKRYANKKGVQIVGDIPIYVSADSSDVWANPQLFQIDEEGRPSVVAGVPPDAFSQDGQLWGNPLYAWEAHKKTGYAWWIARLRQADELFDVTRIDHFRGFAGYYAVPSGEKTAKKGSWVKGPGKSFIRGINTALPGMNIIAEDLGFLTEDVRRLLAFSGYPGMKILQFAFDSREESDYLPHNYTRNSVVYTGTHDNTTTAAFELQAPPADIRFARRYLGILPKQNLARAIVRAALASVANTAIIPMQDWLGLGEEARFNTPSTLGGNNWRWRLVKGQLTKELACNIRTLSEMYGRKNEQAPKAKTKAEGVGEKTAANAKKIAVKKPANCAVSPKNKLPENIRKIGEKRLPKRIT